MSVLKNLARLRISKILTLAVLLTTTILLPQIASAGTLPLGVTERQTCGTFVVDIYSYGAGLMYSIVPTINSHQRLSFISPTENCAVVEWQSSIPATSQVLFSELGNEPVSIDLEAQNFGYPYASTQNNAGIAAHTAVLEGLTPGRAYSYRLVTRSHPSAVPTISDARVLIAGPLATLPTPVVEVINAEVVVPLTTTNSGFGSEKFPIVATVPATKGSDTTINATTAINKVPAAIVAVDAALGSATKEKALWTKLKGFLTDLVPNNARFSLSSNIGLFEKDRYIIPTIFFLGLLFLLQQLVLPALNVDLKKPILYWLTGTVILTVVSAVFMFYYVTLLGIALFLGLLAWYLLKSFPEDNDPTTIQPKLLDVGKVNKNSKKRNRENRPSENAETREK